MRIHKAIEDERPDLVDDIKANAVKVGLDVIDFEDVYTLKKLGAKNESPRGYPNKYTVLRNSKVCLIGNSNDVALYFVSISEWFRTSAIVAVKKTKAGIQVETENSHYLLESQ